ncbi:MAG TPA: phosphoribosylamine--glycine ligase [Acidimicrobiales bacterium]|nr:phosphoribosylamine--glycine ligase [Acidimicrobiales bacterium]
MTRCVVVGSGAREHALAWALAKSADVTVTPGNPGIAAHGFTCVATPATELDADLFVIGPEAPLVAGLADELRGQGKSVVGPGLTGAQLEGSKAYLKEFFTAAGIPTAAYGVFSEEAPALEFLDGMTAPYVIKTDGLAAGKGVLVTNDLEEARRDVEEKLSGAAFGDAGTTIVIEEGLVGEECSFHVLCDGGNVIGLPPSQDFKRVSDGDEGPNTGGMGAYAPMGSMTREQADDIMRLIISPTVSELKRRGIDYRGVLYAGVMLTTTGPKLLEYNVRFGDPETEVLVPLLGDRLFDLLLQVAEGRLGDASAFGGTSGAAVTVVIASEGYPQRPRTGDVIEGLRPDGQPAHGDGNVVVFHAGTTRDEDGNFVTNGGRVLAVTGLGDTVAEARRRAYEAASLITFRGSVRRSDIALAASEGEL